MRLFNVESWSVKYRLDSQQGFQTFGSFFPSSNLSKQLINQSFIRVSMRLPNSNFFQQKLNGQKRWFFEDFGKIISVSFFCSSTSLPLTSTRWVRTTIKLCNVHSLSSVLSLNLSNIKNFWKNLGSAENRTRAGWVWSTNATSMLCCPPLLSKLYEKALTRYGWFNR